jgi:tyrosyl-tRNA synthetase
VWLDPERTSPYRFYQFWINADDRDVGQLLRTFTLLERREIEALDAATQDSPEKREAQRALARDVTRRVHGDEALAAVEQVSQLLFGKGDPRQLSSSALELLGQDIPVFRWDVADPRDTYGLLEVLSAGKDALFKSRGEAKRALEQGGVYLNGERMEAERRVITRSELLPGNRLLVRKGARSYALVVLG